MKKILLTLVLSVCMVNPVWAEEIAYQSFWTSGHELNKTIIEPWCKGMAEATGGKVVMHFNGNNALFRSDATPMAIKNGTLDAGGLQIQGAVAMMPLSNLLALPFLVQDAKEAGIMARKMRETFPEVRAEGDNNFHVLATLGSDRYAFGSTKDLIRTPADLAGKRVLVWAPYQIEEVKAWGGMPVQIISSETYMGLQRGLGEVAYVPYPAIESNKLVEVVKHISMIPSRSLPLAIAINKDVWESLPQAARDYLNTTTGETMERLLGEALVAMVARDMERHKASGVTVYELTKEEQEAFKTAAAPANHVFWVDLLRRYGVADPEGWITKVEALAAETFGW
jgi:C4-dicarboxylate-binding protein DctP